MVPTRWVAYLARYSLRDLATVREKVERRRHFGGCGLRCWEDGKKCLGSSDVYEEKRSTLMYDLKEVCAAVADVKKGQR